MIAKPTSNIKIHEVWPHYNLNYGLIVQTIEFHQITYEQSIAGECKTFINYNNPDEIQGSGMSHCPYSDQLPQTKMSLLIQPQDPLCSNCESH